MAALIKSVCTPKAVNNVMKVTKLLTNLSLSSNVNTNTTLLLIQRLPAQQCALLHTTPSRNDLMEFFDNKDNWGKKKIKVGRSWREDELRIKSNEDLHKLWYVLLKERNMLITMEEAYKEKYEPFPNPERYDKVLESMRNLETVVRERNEAYFMLETGETGERPGKMATGPVGLRYYYRMAQYHIPKFMNSKWHKKYVFRCKERAIIKFLRLYREKLWNQKRKQKNRDRNRVYCILKRFPNVDLEAIKEKYPSVNLEAALTKRKSEGHFIPR